MIHDISLIIPIKDGSELPYLVSLLDDICRQSDIKYRLEIVIVASDDIDKIIKETYRLKDRFEYVPPIAIRDLSGFEGKDPKLSARNWGASNATGDILVFLDCDNKLPYFFISDLTTSIVAAWHVMTYSQAKYAEEGRLDKEKKLIKYQHFLLRFDIVPKIPFAIHKEVFRELGGLKTKNPMITLWSKVCFKYPGGAKKIDTEVLVSPRHILERARKKGHATPTKDKS